MGRASTHKSPSRATDKKCAERVGAHNFRPRYLEISYRPFAKTNCFFVMLFPHTCFHSHIAYNTCSQKEKNPEIYWHTKNVPAKMAVCHRPFCRGSDVAHPVLLLLAPPDFCAREEEECGHAAVTPLAKVTLPRPSRSRGGPGLLPRVGKHLGQAPTAAGYRYCTSMYSRYRSNKYCQPTLKLSYLAA